MKPETDADAISFFQDTRTPATLEYITVRASIDVDPFPDTCLRRAPHDYRDGRCRVCGAPDPYDEIAS
jgi:hypothetical protein